MTATTPTYAHIQTAFARLDVVGNGTNPLNFIFTDLDTVEDVMEVAARIGGKSGTNNTYLDQVMLWEIDGSAPAPAPSTSGGTGIISTITSFFGGGSSSSTAVSASTSNTQITTKMEDVEQFARDALSRNNAVQVTSPVYFDLADAKARSIKLGKISASDRNYYSERIFVRGTNDDWHNFKTVFSQSQFEQVANEILDNSEGVVITKPLLVKLIAEVDKIQKEFDQNISSLSSNLKSLISNVDSKRKALEQEELQLQQQKNDIIAQINAQPWNLTTEAQQKLAILDKQLPESVSIPTLDYVKQNSKEVDKFLIDWAAQIGSLTNLNQAEFQQLETQYDLIREASEKQATQQIQSDIYDKALQQPINLLETNLRQSVSSPIPGNPDISATLPNNFDALLALANTSNQNTTVDLSAGKSAFDPFIYPYVVTLNGVSQTLNDVNELDQYIVANGTSPGVLVNVNQAYPLDVLYRTALKELSQEFDASITGGLAEEVNAQRRSQERFSSNASIVQLYNFFKLKSMESKKLELTEETKVAQNYIDFLALINTIRAQVYTRLEGEIKNDQLIAAGNVDLPPRWNDINDKIRELAVNASELSQYELIVVDKLKELMNDPNSGVINEVKRYQTELTNLVTLFEDLSVVAAQTWPLIEPIDPQFNTKIVARMKAPDINIKVAQQKGIDARLVVTQNNQGQFRIVGDSTIQNPTGTEEILSGSCGSVKEIRDYQRFLGEYLFAKGSDYRGIVAAWGVGTGKTLAAMYAVDKFLERWEAKVQSRIDKGLVPLHEDGDMSNVVQIWSVNDVQAATIWEKEIRAAYSKRPGFKTILPSSFSAKSQAGGIYSTASSAYSQKTKKLLDAGSVDVAVTGFEFETVGGTKFLITLAPMSGTLATLRWMQIPLNYTLTKLGYSKKIIVDSFRSYYWDWDSLSNLLPPKYSGQSLIPILKDFAPFVVLDEMDKFWGPALNNETNAAAEFKFIRNVVLPFHSFSKILGLSATPFDLQKPNFAKIAQIVSTFKYYPSDDINYRKPFEESATGDLIGIDKVVVKDPKTNNWSITTDPALALELKKFFSGFMSYVSLSFDTSIYPFYNANLCKVANDGEELCVAKSEDIAKAASSEDIAKAFKSYLPKDVYGKSKNQVEIRSLREWKYAVPNLLQVLIDDKQQVAEYDKLFDDTKDPVNQNYMPARFYDTSSFDPESFAVVASLPIPTISPPPLQPTDPSDPGYKTQLANSQKYEQLLQNKPKVNTPQYAAWLKSIGVNELEQAMTSRIGTITTDAWKGMTTNTTIIKANLTAKRDNPFSSVVRDKWKAANNGVDLTEAQLMQQSFYDSIGFISPVITFIQDTKSSAKSAASSPTGGWQKNLEELANIKQNFIVGTKLGAYEKGVVAAKLLETWNGKMIFIQTSLTGSDFVYSSFWGQNPDPTVAQPAWKKQTFFAGLKDGSSIDLFDYVPWDPSSAEGDEPSASNWNIGNSPYWYQSQNLDPLSIADPTNQQSQKRKVTNLSKIASKKQKLISDTVDLWYNNNAAKLRVIFLGDKFGGNSAFGWPLVSEVRDLWLALLNDQRNYDGSYFKGVCLTPASTEGISIFDVSMHVNLNPPQKLVTKEQAEGRGFRQCSHSGIGWQHTMVQEDKNLTVASTSNKTVFRVATEYKVGGNPPEKNGIFPEVAVVTMIATFGPNPKGKLTTTSDEIVANWIYRDIDSMGDAFLRFIKTLAVDNSLFGAYSGVRKIEGTVDSRAQDWNVARELIYQAVSDIISMSSTDIKDIADYVEKFYVVQTFNPTQSIFDEWTVFKSRALELAEDGFREKQTDDLYYKIVWFLTRSWQPTPGKYVKKSDLKKWLNADMGKTFLDSGLQKFRSFVDSNGIIDIKNLTQQVEYLKQSSQKSNSYKDDLLKANYLAQYTRDPLLLPTVGYYSEYKSKQQIKGNTSVLPFVQWLSNAIETSAELPGSYLVDSSLY